MLTLVIFVPAPGDSCAFRDLQKELNRRLILGDDFRRNPKCISKNRAVAYWLSVALVNGWDRRASITSTEILSCQKTT